MEKNIKKNIEKNIERNTVSLPRTETNARTKSTPNVVRSFCFHTLFTAPRLHPPHISRLFLTWALDQRSRIPTRTIGRPVTPSMAVSAPMAARCRGQTHLSQRNRGEIEQQKSGVKKVGHNYRKNLVQRSESRLTRSYLATPPRSNGRPPRCTTTETRSRFGARRT